jgi:hypothetical protein
VGQGFEQRFALVQAEDANTEWNFHLSNSIVNAKAQGRRDAKGFYSNTSLRLSVFAPSR